MSATMIESVPDPPQSHHATNDQPSSRQSKNARSSVYLLFSRKWVRLLGVRFPIWAHVAVLLVDRDAPRAAFFDVVSSRLRGPMGGT